ncbi:MAG TPA: hypothetical protein VK111_12015 [Virgibacillus sp.]|nr:hypothetical protein [Virgibacillus sp.]
MEKIFSGIDFLDSDREPSAYHLDKKGSPYKKIEQLTIYFNTKNR